MVFLLIKKNYDEISKKNNQRIVCQARFLMNKIREFFFANFHDKIFTEIFKSSKKKIKTKQISAQFFVKKKSH